jgi:hypothetical protein
VTIAAVAFTAFRLWGLHLTEGRPQQWGVSGIPLNGQWGNHLGAWFAAPLAAAAAGLTALAAVRRRRLAVVIVTAALVAAGWNLGLHLADGPHRLDDSLGSEWDYLAGVAAVGDAPGAYLREFVANLEDQPTHVRSHPPAMVLVLWAMEGVGVGGEAGAVALALLATAVAAAAVLVTARYLAGPAAARRAAPFVALAPGLVFALDMDIVFAALGAVGVALLCAALAAASNRWHGVPVALLSGAVLGFGLLASYGLLAAGAVPAVVAVTAWARAGRAARRRVVAVTATALATAAATVAAPALWGFLWTDGLDATRVEYAKGLASVREYRFFAGANLAVAAFVAGPALVAALGQGPRRWGGVAPVVGAALVAMVMASLTGLSKAEVERIWLPMLVWLPLAAAALPARWRGPAVAAQVAFGLVLAATLETPW